jgi:hypothetical protein
VQVSVLYFAECPNWQEAGRRVRHALDQAGHPATAVAFVEVETDDEAAGLGLYGSPAIIVDGDDLFATHQPPTGLRCLLYSASNGPAGVPDLTDLIAAFREIGTPMTASTPPAADLRRCGCCDRDRPAGKVAELGTPRRLHLRRLRPLGGTSRRTAVRAGRPPLPGQAVAAALTAVRRNG